MRALTTFFLLTIFSASLLSAQQNSQTGDEATPSAQPSIADVARAQKAKKAQSKTHYTLGDEDVRHGGAATAPASAPNGVTDDPVDAAKRELGVISDQEIQDLAKRESQRLTTDDARKAAIEELNSVNKKLKPIAAEVDQYKEKITSLKARLDASKDDAEKAQIKREGDMIYEKMAPVAKEAVQLHQRTAVLKEALKLAGVELRAAPQQK